MTDVYTSDILHNLLRTLEREMNNAKDLEASASSELTAARYRGVQGGLAFAAGYATSILEQLEEVGE